MIILLLFMGNVISFLGVIAPVFLTTGFNTPSFIQNITYAQQHGTAWGSPNTITLHTLYDAFGSVAGPGGVMALIVAVFLVSKTKRIRVISKASVWPAIINVNAPMMFGIPIFLNPLLFLPYVFVPIINSLVGAIVLSLRIVPPAVYRMPPDAPGILQGFLGTGGDWVTLLISIVIFVMDVLLFIPFVRLTDISTGEVKGGVPNEEK